MAGAREPAGHGAGPAFLRFLSLRAGREPKEPEPRACRRPGLARFGRTQKILNRTGGRAGGREPAPRGAGPRSRARARGRARGEPRAGARAGGDRSTHIGRAPNKPNRTNIRRDIILAAGRYRRNGRIAGRSWGEGSIRVLANIFLPQTRITHEQNAIETGASWKTRPSAIV